VNYWLRLYTSILNDPKVQRLAPEHFKGWINLLCLAKENDGALPELADIAWRLRVTSDEARELVSTLQDVGLIETKDGRFTPHNWEGRQYQLGAEDRTAAERARRYRANKRTDRDASRDRHATVTRDATVTQNGNKKSSRRDASVTPEPNARNVTRDASHRAEQSRAETETEQKQSRGALAAAANASELYSDETHASQFTFELIKTYCEETKPRASNPGGLARTLFRTGEEDTDIARWIEERERHAAHAAAPLVGPNDDFSDFNFENYISELIERGDISQLKNEREGIEARGGPQFEWERRVIEYFNNHGAESAT